MDDEIRLTSTELPRMEPTVHHCAGCGMPMTTIGQMCIQCVGKRYLEDALRQQRELVQAHPEHAWETAPDRGHQRHLVLAANRRLAWCGRAIQAAQALRRRFKAPFPPGLCPRCREVYDEFTREAP